MILIRRVVLVGAIGFCSFTLITRLAAAQTHSSVLLVVTKGENSLTIIDPLDGRIMGVVPVGELPHNVAASADGKLAFVANNKGGSISVIDVAARKELRRVNLGPGSRPHGIYFAAGKVYFTADAYKLIGCYDPVSNQIDWLLGTGQDGVEGMLVVTKDGNKIFASNNRSGTITVLERVPASEGGLPWDITQIQVESEPQGIAISPNGKEIWTAHRDGGGVSIIDVTTSKVRRSLHPQTAMSSRMKFTPDGKRVLLSDTINYEVMVFDAEANNPVVIKRLKLEASPVDIVVEPDGSRAYVGLPEDGTIAIIDLKAMEVTTRRISTGKAAAEVSPKKSNLSAPGNHVVAGSFPEGMAWAEIR